MKYETAAIDKSQLLHTVNESYPLILTRLSFMPVGEEGYSYLGEALDGRKYLIKAYSPSKTDLERAFAATERLHEEHGLKEVIFPLRTRIGGFTLAFNEFTVAVFPFIEGQTWWEAGLSDDEWLRLAEFMARLHKTGGSWTDILPIEDYTVPFYADLLGVVNNIAEPRADPTPGQVQLGKLLQREGSDLIQTIQQFECWAEQLRAMELQLALTHGDPTSGNVMKDREGRLFIIDWGDLALGPPERDLVHFTGEQFEPFLERYTQMYGPIRLRSEIFRFYIYRWSLQEIADYGHRILHVNTTEEEDEHCWRELTDYLPLRHEELSHRLTEIERVFQRVLL